MFSRLMKSILTIAKQKNLQQSPHISEPQAPGPLTLNRVLDEFRGCSDLEHRTYPVIQADILYFDHMVDKQKFI
ncbi:MAG: hypothetical protein E7E23_22125, partial [Paenibacillus sp.]|nr:hypothetical protein [Paenibacillus sp.]